jgi:hypothetical protein
METRSQIKIPRQGMEGAIVVSGADLRGIISARARILLLVDGAKKKLTSSPFLSTRGTFKTSSASSIPTSNANATTPGTLAHAPPNAKYHRHGCHTEETSSWSNQLVVRGPPGPSVGVSPIWGPNSYNYGLPLCLVCWPGGRGGGVGCMGLGS